MTHSTMSSLNSFRYTAQLILPAALDILTCWRYSWCSVLLLPLAKTLHQELLICDVLHADETPLTVLNPKT